MPRSRNTALQRYQKEIWKMKHDKTNPTHETSDAQTNKNCKRGTALEQSVGKLLKEAIWSQNTRKPQTGPRPARPQTLTVWRQPYETIWIGSFHLVYEMTNRRAIKEGRKVINHKWVKNHTCSFPQNIRHSEALLGVMGNRGIMSFISREQGNTSLNMKGTVKQM